MNGFNDVSLSDEAEGVPGDSGAAGVAGVEGVAGAFLSENVVSVR